MDRVCDEIENLFTGKQTKAESKFNENSIHVRMSRFNCGTWTRNSLTVSHVCVLLSFYNDNDTRHLVYAICIRVVGLVNNIYSSTLHQPTSFG